MEAGLTSPFETSGQFGDPPELPATAQKEDGISGQEVLCPSHFMIRLLDFLQGST